MTTFHPDWSDNAGDLPSDYNDLPEVECERLMTERVRLLHVYGAPQWHSSVEIVGNRNALTVLRDAIDAVLAGATGSTASTAVMATDGEGYSVDIELDERPWSHPAWEARPPHYVDPVASGRRSDEWMIPLLQGALRVASAQLVKRGIKPIPDPTAETPP